MSDFLLELLSEEIPARMQKQARQDLARLFGAELTEAGLAAEAIETYSTPRRLALIARGLPTETEAVSEERRGPRADAPDKAIDGFLRSTGLSRGDLEEREEKKGTFLYAVIDTPGRKTRAVLAEAIPKIIRNFPWPKSMRWGAASASTESLRWVRPLQGIVAILGDELVECEIDGVVSGYETVGHRFHHKGPITIGGADDYVEKLRACHVIIDHGEREGIVREQGDAVARAAGLERVHDTGLVIENAGLTEWPVPLLGRFDPAYLDLPEEVIQLTARINQKYFICRDREGRLAPNFICTANIDAADGGAGVVAGNEKVLAARLADAQFFWRQDRQKTLAQHAEKLGDIVFHEKLGTVADKVERVAKLARWLVEEGIVGKGPLPLAGEERDLAGAQRPPSRSGEGQAERFASTPIEGDDAMPSPNPLPQAGEGYSLADKAELAGRLAKADLVTGMVGEFADLQGVMGGYYAEAQGLDPEIAAAIRDHYKPVGQGDEVPTAPVTVAVSLADKLDTLISFFVIKERPTGSKDPFALRRAALGVIELILNNHLRLELDYATARASSFLLRQRELGQLDSDEKWITGHLDEELYRAVPDFFVERLKVQQRQTGIRHDIIDSVFALTDRRDDLVLNLARVHALQDFLKTSDGANLLAGYKRAANILKKEGRGGDTPSTVIPAKAGIQGEDGAMDSRLRGNDEVGYDPQPEEHLLREALGVAERKADAAIAAEDFEGAMAALAGLRKPIDAFFDNVTVNDENDVKRESRLQMLEKMRDAVHRVADFSKIEG